jgi:hypothetical protein
MSKTSIRDYPVASPLKFRTVQLSGHSYGTDAKFWYSIQAPTNQWYLDENDNPILHTDWELSVFDLTPGEPGTHAFYNDSRRTFIRATKDEVFRLAADLSAFAASI